ncbi:MAG: hypothetical protein IJH59_02340, partial [Firmicutes bacterium]|nr:hypothetical protein [Bacillota bacterium]
LELLCAGLFDPFFYDLFDFFSGFFVFDVAGAVVLARTDVYHRIEFDKIVAGFVEPEVNSPESVLRRTAFKKSALDVGVHLGIETDDFALDVDDCFHHPIF